MEGNANKLLVFFGNMQCTFTVPVYQRPYSWTTKQCAKLVEDLTHTHEKGLRSHFFGSLVLKGEVKGTRLRYVIIDGQQRLTTVSLLLLALRDLLRQGVLRADTEPTLADELQDNFLLHKYAAPGSAPHLRLGNADMAAWETLLGLRSGDLPPGAPLKRNYDWLADWLRRTPLSPESVFAALGRLEIIGITLSEADDPQLIFESLNATGLALTEGDKVRNFLLMDLPEKEQECLYRKYWTAIERHTDGEVSELTRDFLSVKRQETPRLDEVYLAFKQFVAERPASQADLLAELARYAKWFGLLRQGGDRAWGPALRGSLFRLNRLKLTVVRPFALEVLRLHEEGTLTEDDLARVFAMLEAYLFRRIVCEVPTNALNKIFLTLNGDVLRLAHGDARYVDVLAYVLRAKTQSGRFPDDEEFRADLATRQVYKMNRLYKHYLFERLENGNSKETKDVYAHLDALDYSIEHILPQRLTPAWRESLGERCNDIHATWLHRLGNLTLTAYNPNLSNATFPEKRDAPNGGYRASGLRLNQHLGQLERWGEAELEARTRALCERALALWPLPKTDFAPAVRQWDAFSLADEDSAATGRKPARYRYRGAEFPVKDWAALFVGVMRMLADDHRAELQALADDRDAPGFAWIAAAPDSLQTPTRLAEGLYFDAHSSTNWRLRRLRALFERLGEDPGDLQICLQEGKAASDHAEALKQLHYAFWAFALPTLQAQCPWLANRNPTCSDELITHRPGFRGYELHYGATASCAKVFLAIWLKTAADNKAAFDRLAQHRKEIDERFGAPLQWVRYDQGRSAWIEYRQTGLSVRNREDWPRILAFHERWGLRLWNAVAPFLPHAPAPGDADGHAK